MKVKKLKELLDEMDEDGSIEICVQSEGSGDYIWYDFKFDRGSDNDREHALLILEEVVME